MIWATRSKFHNEMNDAIPCPIFMWRIFVFLFWEHDRIILYFFAIISALDHFKIEAGLHMNRYGHGTCSLLGKKIGAKHYSDVQIGAMAFEITSRTIVYSTVYSDKDQRKYQSSASLAFVGEFTGHRWISRRNGQYHGNCFHLMLGINGDYDFYVLDK